MAAPPVTSRPPVRPPLRLRLTLPSWLVSLVVHAALLILLMLTVRFEPRGQGGGTDRDGLSIFDGSGFGDGSGDYFDDEPSGGGSGRGATLTITPAENTAAGKLFDDAPPVDATAALPKTTAAAGLGPLAEGIAGATGAGGFTSGSGSGSGFGAGSGSGPGGRGSGGPAGGRARTKLYGIESDGYKFIYVFDRSGSMGGSGPNTPLASAKANLLASLDALGETHQFQIIFYNENPTMFALAGQPNKLVFGTPANRTTAEQFVRGITADGGTRHEEALWMALKLQPDVIYFLTDADQPELSPTQLNKIERANNGHCSINTIEFGLGPKVGDENFLMRLARENNGRYVYVDVSKGALNR